MSSNALAAKGFSAAEKESGDKKFEATCPVSGKPAIESSFVEMKDGSKVYFCCENCPKAYEKDPKKFAMKANRQLLETGQIVASRLPADRQAAQQRSQSRHWPCRSHVLLREVPCQVREGGRRSQVETRVQSGGREEGLHPPNQVPCERQDIDPEHSVEYKGEKVYFCCPNCPGAFEKDPTKFVAKLPQFKKETEKAKK